METIDKYETENGTTFFSLKIDGREVARMLIIITPGLLNAGHTGVDLSQKEKWLWHTTCGRGGCLCAPK